MERDRTINIQYTITGNPNEELKEDEKQGELR